MFGKKKNDNQQHIDGFLTAHTQTHPDPAPQMQAPVTPAHSPLADANSFIMTDAPAVLPTTTPVNDPGFSAPEIQQDVSPAEQVHVTSIPAPDPVPLPEPAPELIPEPVVAPEPLPEPTPEPMPEPTPYVAPVEPVSNDLLALKQAALHQLTPIVNLLDQAPEDKFRTTMMMLQSTDDQNLVAVAYQAAQSIPDDKVRAQALLDVVNEINYFTQKNTQG